MACPPDLIKQQVSPGVFVIGSVFAMHLSFSQHIKSHFKHFHFVLPFFLIVKTIIALTSFVMLYFHTFTSLSLHLYNCHFLSYNYNIFCSYVPWLVEIHYVTSQRRISRGIHGLSKVSQGPLYALQMATPQMATQPFQGWPPNWLPPWIPCAIRPCHLHWYPHKL
jgi:hypothetical protein